MVKKERISLMTRRQVRDLSGKLMEEWQSVDAVADVLGCQPATVRKWYMDYKHRSSQDLSPSKEMGRPSKLSLNQQNIIQDIIFTKNPRDMNYPFDLWANTVIQDMVQDLFHIKLSIATVNSIIYKLGIIKRQRLRPDGKGNQVELKDWLTNRLTSIRKLAKRQQASLFFIHDEIVSPAGLFQKPSNDILGGHQRTDIRVISAVCPRNSQRFMTFPGNLNAQSFVKFVKGLLHDTDRSLYLIAESQYKQIVREADLFFSKKAELVSLFFCPPS
jgi:transposase